jgi:phosphoribosylglycinamide formyltransferase-1
MNNIAVFASHGGSDLQALMDGCKAGKINARVCVVISNNSNSKALQRAKNEGIKAVQKREKTTPAPGEATLQTLREHNPDIIFLEK